MTSRKWRGAENGAAPGSGAASDGHRQPIANGAVTNKKQKWRGCGRLQMTSRKWRGSEKWRSLRKWRSLDGFRRPVENGAVSKSGAASDSFRRLTESGWLQECGVTKKSCANDHSLVRGDARPGLFGVNRTDGWRRPCGHGASTELTKFRGGHSASTELTKAGKTETRENLTDAHGGMIACKTPQPQRLGGCQFPQWLNRRSQPRRGRNIRGSPN